MKKSAFGGIALALAGIAAGLYLDGGKFGQMLQPTAALIVFGGTLGAVIVQFPVSVLHLALRQLKPVFGGEDDQLAERVAALSRYAAQARRNGLLSLDREIEAMDDPYLRLCVTLAVDGMKPDLLRPVAAAASDKIAAQDALLPRVYDAAGGFAPTVGIIGAVIGLIQVMQKMQNINEVGQGIAVAFVATLYGVGAANLFFLPCAGRIKLLAARRQLLREVTMEGVACIADGLSPRSVEQRLSAYVESPAAALPVAKLAGR